MRRGAGNNGPVSTALASSFLNAADRGVGKNSATRGQKETRFRSTVHLGYQGFARMGLPGLVRSYAGLGAFIPLTWDFMV